MLYAGHATRIIHMFGLGFSELLLIFLIVFILFGANKLPQLGAGMGQAIRNFTKAMKGEEGKDDKKDAAETNTHKPV